MSQTNFDVEEVVAKQHQRRENIALRNVFNMLDVNKDGYLCKYDVRESMASLQSPVDMEEAEIMVRFPFHRAARFAWGARPLFCGPGYPEYVYPGHDHDAGYTYW